MPLRGLFLPHSMLLDKAFQLCPLKVCQPAELDAADPVALAVRRVVDLKIRHNLTKDIIGNDPVVGIGDHNMVKRAAPFVGSGIACSQPLCADVDEGCRVKNLRFADEAKPGGLFKDNVRSGPNSAPGCPPLALMDGAVHEMFSLIDICKFVHGGKSYYDIKQFRAKRE